MKKFLTRCLLEVGESIAAFASMLAYLILAGVVCHTFNLGEFGLTVVITMLTSPCIGTFMAVTDYFYRLKSRYQCFY